MADDRRPYKPAHDPRNVVQGNNESVPNVIPHIHGSTTGKRYCDHCGQPMLENELTRPQGTYRGDIQLPVLRSRSNLETPFISEGVIAKDVVVSTVGFTRTTVIARSSDIEIGQMPKGSTRAHINMRDVCATALPIAGAITALTGFLHYTDVIGKNHVVCALAFNASANSQAFSMWADSLIVDTVITDGAPPHLGFFTAEVVGLTLGAATGVFIDIRANMSVMFEV